MRLGMLVQSESPQEKKLDPRTINGYFIGYAEKSKGYRFYYPSHSTKIVESRNEKILEDDLISGSDQLNVLVYVLDRNEYQPSISSDRLVITHTPQAQTCVRPPIGEIPQVNDVDPLDQVVNQDNVEQPIEQSIE